MTKPTQIALASFGLLIFVGLVVSSLSPGMPMPLGTFGQPQAQPTPLQMGDTPTDQTSMSSLPILADHIPEFSGITRWWNTPNNGPLTPASLKGKVVLVDFWTYSCINCIRTYPFMRAMQEKYAKDGLVIIGVHTPEFAFEADPDNVGREIVKNDLQFPVALDPKFETWNNFSNQYWPAKYFFDKQGRLRFTHFGEGKYEESEQVIRDLLAEGTGEDLGAMANVQDQDLSAIQTPETYFGLSRGDAFDGTVGAAGKPIELKSVGRLPSDKWNADGTWIFTNEYVEAASAKSVFRFNVQANTLHIVMESADHTDKLFEVYVDGKKAGDLKVNASTLYDVAQFPDAKRHTVELRFPDPGVRLFAATFS